MAKVVVIGLSGESIFLRVDMLPNPGMTTHANQYHIEPGGKGYNQAVACKKMGVDVSYLTKVGKDAYGKYCQEYMERLGIKGSFMIDESKNTALAMILTDCKGENEVIVYPGASSCLTANDVVHFEKEISSAQVLLLQYELPMDVIEKAMQIAKKNNILILLNPAPAKISNPTFLEQADIVIPNLEEAKQLCQLPDTIAIEEIGPFLQEKVNNQWIVTLGKEGCVYIKKGYHRYYTSLKVNALDTTGAGDVFNAGIASSIALGDSIAEAIQFATVASSISVTKQYVMNAIPTIEEIREKSNQYKYSAISESFQKK